MPCYSPLLAYRGRTLKTKNGKSVIKFSVSSEDRKKDTWDLIKINCGQCWGCRLERTKQWATRLMLETKTSSNNWFVTLTYDEENIKYNLIRTELGAETFQTLVKKDAQDFIKRLREHFRRKGYIDEKGKSPIRYYLCGEYGENTERPHYHAILYNLPLDDLEVIGHNSQHDPYYKSDLIEKIWGKGIVTIGEVTYQSARYVRRYVLKKMTGEAERRHQEQEFQIYSKNPPLGGKYFKQNYKKIYEFDEIILPVRNGRTVKILPPKSYDKMLEKIDERWLDQIKQERMESRTINNSNKLKRTSLSPEDYLKIEEYEARKKLITLHRNYEEEEG